MGASELEVLKSQSREWFIKKLPKLQRRLNMLSAVAFARPRQIRMKDGSYQTYMRRPDAVSLQATLAGIQYALGKPEPKSQAPQIMVPIQIVFPGGRTAEVIPAPVEVTVPPEPTP